METVLLAVSYLCFGSDVITHQPVNARLLHQSFAAFTV